MTANEAPPEAYLRLGLEPPLLRMLWNEPFLSSKEPRRQIDPDIHLQHRA